MPFPSPGDLPDPESEPMFLVSPALAGGFFATEPPGKHSGSQGEGRKPNCTNKAKFLNFFFSEGGTLINISRKYEKVVIIIMQK